MKCKRNEDNGWIEYQQTPKAQIIVDKLVRFSHAEIKQNNEEWDCFALLGCLPISQPGPSLLRSAMLIMVVILLLLLLWYLLNNFEIQQPSGIDLLEGGSDGLYPNVHNRFRYFRKAFQNRGISQRSFRDGLVEVLLLWRLF